MPAGDLLHIDHYRKSTETKQLVGKLMRSHDEVLVVTADYVADGTKLVAYTKNIENGDLYPYLCRLLSDLTKERTKSGGPPI